MRSPKSTIPCAVGNVLGGTWSAFRVLVLRVPDLMRRAEQQVVYAMRNYRQSTRTHTSRYDMEGGLVAARSSDMRYSYLRTLVAARLARSTAESLLPYCAGQWSASDITSHCELAYRDGLWTLPHFLTLDVLCRTCRCWSIWMQDRTPPAARRLRVCMSIQ